MKKVYVVLFDGFTTLDAFGPVDVLGRVDGLDITFVSLEGGIISNDQNIHIETFPMNNLSAGEIMLLPGGYGTRNMCRDEAFLATIFEAAGRSEYVLSVCTGAALLAKAGLLDGKKATTNKLAFEWVSGCSDKVEWIKDARWIKDGKFYTSAGVSAGIDMALGFVRDVFGREKAAAICREMEYTTTFI